MASIPDPVSQASELPDHEPSLFHPTATTVLKTIAFAILILVTILGAIYVGSESGGIYRFSPTDGSSTQITTDGQYQGSSITIGPDGTLYAGSVDGTVYAINPDGTYTATGAFC